MFFSLHFRSEGIVYVVTCKALQVLDWVNCSHLVLVQPVSLRMFPAEFLSEAAVEKKVP